MESARTVVEDAPASGREYTLVVALSNPATVDQLMRTAIDLAADRGGQIRVVSVIHKHATSPFMLFPDERIKREFDDGQGAVLDEAVEVAEGSSVPVRRSLLVGSNVSGTLRGVVEETEADALLLGWQDRALPSDIVLGATVDPLVRRAPCDVFVERVGATADGMDAILLPTDGGPHMEPATDLAGAVARANDTTVTVVSYVPPAATETERDAAQARVDGVERSLGEVALDGGVRETSDVADAIVDAATDHDLVVLGATRERRFRGRVVGSVADAVGERAAPPIVIARRRSERSLLGRALQRWS